MIHVELVQKKLHDIQYQINQVVCQIAYTRDIPENAGKLAELKVRKNDLLIQEQSIKAALERLAEDSLTELLERYPEEK